MINKNHFYCGLFYNFFIAPNQDRLIYLIKKNIESNSSVIDVGFGTGWFSFPVANKVSKVVRVDLSKKYRKSKIKFG